MLVDSPQPHGGHSRYDDEGDGAIGTFHGTPFGMGQALKEARWKFVP